MKWPPALRFLLPMVLLLFAATTSLISTYYGRAQEARNLDLRFRERAEILGTRMAGMSAWFLENNTLSGGQREVALTALDRDLRLALVFDASERAVFSTQYELQNRPIAETPAIAQAKILRRARETRTGQIDMAPDGRAIYGAFPFPITPRQGGAVRDTEFGVVYIDFDLGPAKARAEVRNAWRLYISGAVLLALCGIFTLIFGPLFTSRIRRLADAARRLAGGDLATRSGLHGSDELGELGKAFDQMASDLQSRAVALRESEARFRSLVEGIPQAFWLSETEPVKVLYVAPAFERIWGRPVESFERDVFAWTESIPAEDRPKIVEKFRAWLEGKTDAFDEIFRITAPDGTKRWVRHRGIRFAASPEGRRRVAGVAEDVSAQRKLEEEQAAIELKLQETQKLESLGVLAGGIAHDFNNLLTGILGNSSLARQELSSTSPVQSHLAQIEAVAVRAADLCKQMLAYSGKGRFQVQHLDLNELIHETGQLLQLSISKTANLRYHLTDSLPSIEADVSQIRQVLMNLVINASEAIIGQGTISLNTGVILADREYLEKTVLSPELPEGHYVYLEVSDTGSGMPPETQARIFEPFFTTKFAGRGLGLSAVLGIVRGHKGALRVYSEPGKGTTFKLIFPVAPGEAAPLTQEEGDSSWTGTGTILIVDDDETVRIVTSRMVERFGFTSLLATNGLEGVDTFRARHAEITAVLMDLTMPHMDGEEAFRAIRGIDPKVRVLLMSGFNEQDAINRFTGKGLAGFVQKPFKPDQLRKKLRAILQAE